MIIRIIIVIAIVEVVGTADGTVDTVTFSALLLLRRLPDSRTSYPVAYR